MLMNQNVLIPTCYNVFSHEPLNECFNTVAPFARQQLLKQHGICENRGQDKLKFMMKLGCKNNQIIDSLEQAYDDNAPNKSATYT